MAPVSHKALVIAMVANGTLALIKLAAALAGGSAALLSTALHGLADACHQGLRHRVSGRSVHPRAIMVLYGLGAGLGCAGAWHAWRTLGAGQEVVLVGIYGPYFVDPWALNMAVLLVACAVQGYAFRVALAQWRAPGQADDPSHGWLVLEGAFALLGLGLAICGTVLMIHTGNAAWDAAFAVPVALMPAAVAVCLWQTGQRFRGEAP